MTTAGQFCPRPFSQGMKVLCVLVVHVFGVGRASRALPARACTVFCAERVTGGLPPRQRWCHHRLHWQAPYVAQKCRPMSLNDQSRLIP
eukprot:4641172-Amphidinium_carterae.1